MVDPAIVSVAVTNSNPVEFILSNSGVYSVWDPRMLSLRNFRKMGYVALCTHERGTPSISVSLPQVT